MAGSKPTIKDIARICGVSITTVSKVVNKKHAGIGGKTVERVMAAVREYGYHPNAVARSMITRKTLTVGLVLPDVRNPFFAELARGVEDVCNNRGYGCFLCNTDGDMEKEDACVAQLRGRVADGILFTTQNSVEFNPVFDRLRADGYPFCLIERYLDAMPDAPGVYFDNVGGARMAVRHLLDKGHRRIAFIAGPQGSVNARLRREGYELALLEAGVAPDPALRADGDYHYGSGHRAADSLLARNAARRRKRPGFSALFASNDLMALGAYQRLEEEGLRVPEDVSIVSFDNAPFPAVMRPKVTTIELPAYAMGARAAEMLFDVLDGRAAAGARHVFLPKLVEKGSVRDVREA